jgi:GNAT superfamily N-acetyltransferase
MKLDINLSTDIRTALGIAKRNSHFFNGPGLDQMKKDMEEHKLIGAFNNGGMCGFIVFKELNEKAVELAWMAVDPTMQGNGIGSVLVEQGISLLEKPYLVCQMKTLSEVDPDLQYSRTRKFYLNRGFIPLETISPYPGWGDDNPCQIFIKILPT